MQKHQQQETVNLTKVMDDYFKYFSYQYFWDLQFYYITAYKRVIKSYTFRHLLIKQMYVRLNYANRRIFIWLKNTVNLFQTKAFHNSNLVSKKHGVDNFVIYNKWLVFLSDLSSWTSFLNPAKKENESIHWSKARTSWSCTQIWCW